MNRWYIPSWNGDLRLEASGDETNLSIEKPTPGEIEILAKMKEAFLAEGWIAEADWKDPSRWRKRVVTIKAPIAKVGPVASSIMRPGEAVLTAITLTDGRVVTHSGADVEGLKQVAAEAAADGAKDAATVKRPTPCCPQCFEGAIGPATEVLLSFLTPEQHETWASGRYLIVEGGLSGARYLLAHRNSPLAQEIGRICYELDADQVVHFHDRSVPPEEEVLAALLILRHREPWLRNEATLFGDDVLSDRVRVFKNPFGDYTDGLADAAFTQEFGRAAIAAHASKR